MRKAFTLVELMIVVAIIGILAAIAIPNFVAMQYKAKRAEVPVNVSAIQTAEIGFDALYDGYCQADAHPSTLPGKSPVAWTGNTGFDSLGWRPDGTVRGQYSVTTVPGRASSDGGSFTVTGQSDVDGDGDIATFTALRDSRPIMTTANSVY